MEVNSIKTYYNLSKQAFGMAKAGKNLQNLINKTKLQCKEDDVLEENFNATKCQFSQIYPNKIVEIKELPDCLLLRLFDPDAKCSRIYLNDKYIGCLHRSNSMQCYNQFFDITHIVQKYWNKTKKDF